MTALLLACGRVPEPQGHAPTDGGMDASEAPLTARERRGKALFTRGRSPDGHQLTAVVGGGEVELPASSAACTRCHGPRGKGTEEGATVAPPIDARALFERVGPGGRVPERPAYTEATLVEAITLGRAASGRELGAAMPRFPLRTDDLSDLVAYLRRVADDVEPGVSARSVRVGATLPMSGEERPLGEAVAGVLEAAFAEVNRTGGIFRRRIELVVEDSAVAPGSAARLLERGVLALVGSVTAPSDEEALVAAGAISLAPVRPPAVAREDGPVYHLYAGPEGQARAAVVHWLGEHHGRSRTSVVVQEASEGGEVWARGVREELERRSAPPPRVVRLADATDPVGLARAACAKKPDAVFAFVATAERAGAVARACRGTRLHFADVGVSLVPRSDIDDAARFAHTARIDSDPASDEAFRSLSRRHGVAERYPRERRDALAAATLLVHALKRGGVDVTRAGLQAAVESFRDVETATTPPVSFGTTRRVGVTSVELAKRGPNGALVPASKRIEPPPR